MFQRIIGIVCVLAVAVVIVKVALSPRTEGFFPGMFDFLKCQPRIETDAPRNESDTLDADEGTFPETAPTVAPADTLSHEQQIDTLLLVE